MSHEARNDIPSDLRQECLLSLADAVDALAKAAATVAAVARTTAHRFSMDAPVSPGVQVNQGINRGKAPDNFYKPMSDQMGGVNKGPHLDVADDEDDHPSSGQSALLPMSIGASRQDWRTSNAVNQPYRLLVDSEADVLLFVCALIDKYQRVICYLPCSPGPLTTYKRLVESVTQSPVHILNSTASSKLDQASANFLENEGAVLLVPETLSPKIEITGDNSWVIHAGWPVSEAQYITQRKSHKAQNNILVAYSGDRTLYPSGNNIVEQTEPWPKDGASFRASISILRPLYEATLSELPFEMKKRVYSDWLQFRGLHGPRRVEAWTASTMVQRANAYLMDVWRWSGLNAGDNPTPFPAVSTRFVAHNGLQSAVQDGFLRVEDDDTDSHQPAPTPLPRLEPSSTQIDFLSTTGHTYFALSEEFDAIPLMCFIASKYDKVICFLEGQGSLRHYQKLLGKIMGRSVFYPTALSNDHATEEAVLQFISATTPAVLLLACNTANLPSILNERSIDCCIYWGFGVPLKPATRNRNLIKCTTTIIIMLEFQQRALSVSSDLRSHPSASIPLDLTENSLLTPMRNRTRSVLTSSVLVVRELYTNRVYGIGPVPRTSLSAEDVARRANQYAARVLLHGDPVDGSETFPPVGGRPSVPRLTVDKFSLQPAVDAGLLTVVG